MFNRVTSVNLSGIILSSAPFSQSFSLRFAPFSLILAIKQAHKLVFLQAYELIIMSQQYHFINTNDSSSNSHLPSKLPLAQPV